MNGPAAPARSGPATLMRTGPGRAPGRRRPGRPVPEPGGAAALWNPVGAGRRGEELPRHAPPVHRRRHRLGGGSTDGEHGREEQGGAGPEPYPGDGSGRHGRDDMTHHDPEDPETTGGDQGAGLHIAGTGARAGERARGKDGPDPAGLPAPPVRPTAAPPGQAAAGGVAAGGAAAVGPGPRAAEAPARTAAARRELAAALAAVRKELAGRERTVQTAAVDGELARAEREVAAEGGPGRAAVERLARLFTGGSTVLRGVSGAADVLDALKKLVDLAPGAAEGQGDE